MKERDILDKSAFQRELEEIDEGMEEEKDSYDDEYDKEVDSDEEEEDPKEKMRALMESYKTVARGSNNSSELLMQMMQD